MMQAKWAQHPQHKAINQCANIARGFHQIPDAKDNLLKMWPYDKHYNPEKNCRKRSDYRNKPGAPKEAQKLRQLSLVETVMQ